MARPHLEASGVPYHGCAEGMLRQAHALGFGQSPHGAVEMGRASEVEQGAGKLAVGHNDDVQSSVPPPWPRELAYTQVFLLLAILLLAHQVIRQEPWLNTGRLLGRPGTRPWAILSSHVFPDHLMSSSPSSPIYLLGDPALSGLVSLPIKCA